MSDDKPTVTIYSATWCAFCHAAKRYLDSKKVAYKDVDIDKDPEAARAMQAKTGMTGVPVIYIGDEVILGFDRAKIDSALAKYKLV